VAELEGFKIKCKQLEESLQQSEERFRKILHASPNAVAASAQEKESNSLRKSEEKYRTLVENSLQGLSIVQNGRYVFCNQAFAEMSGYSVEELLSFSPEEMEAMVHVDDRNLIEERHFGRMAGNPVPSLYERRRIKKDGTEQWLEIYSGIIEYNGKTAIQSTFIDITERKKTAENLQRALDWQKAIFEGSQDAILISDIDSKFVDVNTAACKLTGYSKEELLKMRPPDLQANADFPRLEALHNRILAGEDLEGETKIRTKDGREIDVEFGHLRVMISGVPYVHTIARDITNRKRLEAQFLQAQKMEAVGALAGGVAHDFNNLLTVIRGYTEMLLETLAPDDPKYRDLALIQKAGQQAASLIAQLLAFSRKQVLQPEVLELNEAVAEMSTMLRRLIGEDVNLVVDTQPGAGQVYADPGQLQQIVMNLAVNARDAMPQGGKLTIKTANVDFDMHYVREHPMVKPGPYVMLAISDNGLGMDAATQARIFEPFFTTKETGKGTGLGLSTVYGIVKQSNGFIWVYSEPGKGTTFKIYFPRVEDKPTKVMTENKSESGSRGFETVLVVEDEGSVRALASRILRERGYSVLEASGSKEAVDVAREYAKEIHLVLTDVIMPDMSGRELVSWLEAVRPGIKALYISGYTDDAIVHHGMLDSNVAFLQKPFTVEGLSRKVREVIDS
jgi:PAS domain S-box-containing protein